MRRGLVLQHLRWLVAAGVAVVALGSLGGCGSPAAVDCQQPALVLGSLTLTAGEEVNVSAPSFGCPDQPYPAGETYQLVLSVQDSMDTYELRTATPARDGSFSTTVRLPDRVAGPGAVRVIDADRGVPTCGPAESCAAWAAQLTVQAPV
jgi:hypothetical protein